MFPPAEDICDNLRIQNVAVEVNTHAQRVWADFGCATLGDSANVYLKTDVPLLVDVFERFRDVSETLQTRSGPPDHSSIISVRRHVVKD